MVLWGRPHRQILPEPKITTMSKMINFEEIQSRLDRGVASLTDTCDLLCEVKLLRGEHPQRGGEVMNDRYDKLAKCMDCTPEEIPILIQKHFPWNGRKACDCFLESQKENEELSKERLAALIIAEQENSALRQQVAELCSLGVSLHKAAAAGAQSEREAVVAWLRAQSPNYRLHMNAIKRGEHRKEKE